MEDLKNKLKATAEKAKKKLDESNIQDKLKDAANKAQKKLEESNIQEKVSETLNKENADIVMNKAKDSALFVKKIISKVNFSKKMLVVGCASVATAVVAVVGISAVLGTTESKLVKINGEEINYVYNENKFFGEAYNIDDGLKIKITPENIVFDILSLKNKSMLQTPVHTPGKTNKMFSNLAMVIKVNNLIFGGNMEVLFQKGVFKVGEEELKGYKVYIVDEDAKKLYTMKPDYKIVFTKYYTKEELEN